MEVLKSYVKGRPGYFNHGLNTYVLDRKEGFVRQSGQEMKLQSSTEGSLNKNLQKAA